MTSRIDTSTRIETVLDYHLGKERHSKPRSEQINLLMQRKRRFLFVTIINMLAIIFFGYWFLSGITELPSWIFWILAVVFTLNLVSIAYQKKQIDEAISYLQSGQNPTDTRKQI